MDNLVELYVAGMENPVSVDARWESLTKKLEQSERFVVERGHQHYLDN